MSKKSFLMCSQCRKDKKKCEPEERSYRVRCNRCVGRGLDCGPSVGPDASPEKCVWADADLENKRNRQTADIITELDYILYLKRKLHELMANRTPDGSKTNKARPPVPKKSPLIISPQNLKKPSGYISPSTNGRLELAHPQATLGSALLAIDEIYIGLKSDSLAMRDFLIAEGKFFEAKLLSEMISLIPLQTGPRESKSLEESCFPEIFDSSAVNEIEKLFWYVKTGRIFTAVTLLGSSELLGQYDDFEFDGLSLEPERSMRLFMHAKNQEDKFLTKYVTQVVRERSSSRDGDIAQLMRSIDSLDIKAVQALNDEQTVKYLEREHIRLLRHPPKGSIFALYEALQPKIKSGISPITRHYFFSRLPYRRLIKDLSGLALGIEANDAALTMSREPEMLVESFLPADDSCQRVVEAHNLLLPIQQFSIKSEVKDMMKFYPLLELNTAAVAAAKGDKPAVERILVTDPSQLSVRFPVSDDAYLRFDGPGNQIKRFSDGFTALHFAAWNKSDECLEILLKQSNAYTLSLCDIVDLYSIAIMQDSVDVLRVLNCCTADTMGRPESEPSREEVITLIIMYASCSVVMEALTQPKGWPFSFNPEEHHLSQVQKRIAFWENVYKRENGETTDWKRSKPDTQYTKLIHEKVQEAQLILGQIALKKSKRKIRISDLLNLPFNKKATLMADGCDTGSHLNSTSKSSFAAALHPTQNGDSGSHSKSKGAEKALGSRVNSSVSKWMPGFGKENKEPGKNISEHMIPVPTRLAPLPPPRPPPSVPEETPLQVPKIACEVVG